MKKIIIAGLLAIMATSAHAKKSTDLAPLPAKPDASMMVTAPQGRRDYREGPRRGPRNYGPDRPRYHRHGPPPPRHYYRHYPPRRYYRPGPPPPPRHYYRHHPPRRRY